MPPCASFFFLFPFPLFSLSGVAAVGLAGPFDQKTSDAFPFSLLTGIASGRTVLRFP